MLHLDLGTGQRVNEAKDEKEVRMRNSKTLINGCSVVGASDGGTCTRCLL